MRSDAAVGVGREDPGVNDVVVPGLHEPGQPAERQDIKLPTLGDLVNRDAGRSQVLLKRTQARERSDLDRELVARQARRQQHHLLLSA